jgi:S-DNA-T family DNA segregation ATPase FtsK/SpoIIIE
MKGMIKMKKQGARVNLNYVLTDITTIVLMVLIVFIILPFLMNFIGSNKLSFLDWYSYRVQKIIYKKLLLRYILLEIVLVSGLVWLIVKYLTRKGADVNKKLAKFIKYNNFLVYEAVNGKKKLKDKADVRYTIKDEILIIDIYLHGSQFDEKLKQSREKLEDIFKTSISSMSMDFGKLSYKISFKGIERLRTIQYIPKAIKLDNSRIWDYNSIPHGLIAGATGSGKTYFLNYVICSLLHNQADITFIDPKSADVKAIGEVVNKEKTACKENDIVKLVEDFSKEMTARQEIIGNSGKVNATYLDFDMKPMFLIFDELSAFKAGVELKKTATDVENQLKKIILMGRSTGNFVILVAQQPNANVIETGIRDQLGLKVALGNIKNELRLMMFGAEIKLHTLDSTEKGVGYISLAGSEPYKFYAPDLGAKYDFIKEIEKLKVEKVQIKPPQNKKNL